MYQNQQRTRIRYPIYSREKIIRARIFHSHNCKKEVAARKSLPGIFSEKVDFLVRKKPCRVRKSGFSGSELLTRKFFFHISQGTPPNLIMKGGSKNFARLFMENSHENLMTSDPVMEKPDRIFILRNPFRQREKWAFF